MNRINGGSQVGFWSEGSIHFFTITVPAGALNEATALLTVRHPQVSGQTVTSLVEVPNGMVSKVIEVINNGTSNYVYGAGVVGLEYTEGTTTIKVALNRCNWTAANLQLALRDLGAAVTVNKYSADNYGTDVTPTITTQSVDFTSITVATAANFVGSAT